MWCGGIISRGVQQDSATSGQMDWWQTSVTRGSPSFCNFWTNELVADFCAQGIIKLLQLLDKWTGDRLL
jgi:hypothetical protein